MAENDLEREHVIYMASWTSLETGVVSLRRDWVHPQPPEFRWGPKDLPLRNVRRAPLSDYGNISGYFIKKDRLSFVVRADRYAEIDLSAEPIYVAGDFNGWADAVGKKEWQLRPMKLDGREFYGLSLKPGAIDHSQHHCFKFVTASGVWLDVPASAPNVMVDAEHNRNYQLRPHRTGLHRFFFETPEPLNHSPEPYLTYIEGEYRESMRLMPGVFLKKLETSSALGARIEGDQTVFRLFAPRASQVSLLLMKDPDASAPETLRMTPNEEMVWELAVEGNRAGWFYYFTIDGHDQDGFCHFDASFRVLDPYALACAGPLGPGIVVDQRSLPRIGTPFTPPKWHDLVVVETHLRDLLGHAPIQLEEDERLGYAGLRKWIQDRGCYLRELGINAVELQPIQEFDTVDPKEYGWGYMPVNYFSPASQYASDPTKASQIEEFKAVVDAFHEAGLAVILDVVYNHVGNPNYLQYIDKQYYFLLNQDGEYMNWSGCGNTIDPDTPMSRRLMRDSLVHLLETFDVDGFRFDLGELIGIDCLSYLEKEVKAVKPSTFLVAEPWSFRAHIADQFKETGVAFWNDGFREFLREYLVNGGTPEGLSYYMQGSREDLTAFPAQTVNYVCSHDDQVWIDKITENKKHDGSFPTPNDRRRTHLMGAVLLLSVGIPMLHAGLDFLYSKGGKNNTYLEGNANALPYERMRFFAGTHEYFRRLIEFRQSAIGRLLRLDGHPERGFFNTATEDRAFAMQYNAHRERGAQQIIFAINPTFETLPLTFPGVDWENWVQIADHERVELTGLQTARFFVHEETVELPALSCGIWIRS